MPETYLKTRRLPIPLILLTIAAAGCHSTAPPASPANASSPVLANVDRSFAAFAQTDPWLLTTTDPKANRGNHGIFIGNVYEGATFGSSGGGGKGAAAFVAGNYDKAENLLPAQLWQNAGLPEPKAGETYSQTLDMRDGVLTTKAGAATITTFASAADRFLAVINVSGGTFGTAAPKIEGTTQVTDRNEPDGSWTRLRWSGFPWIHEYMDEHRKTPYEQTYAELLAAHKAAWANQWKGADIRIDGDPEAQQLVHKLMFDLMQSSGPAGHSSIPPESLSGDFYKGHIFWDAEVWMFPALLAQHPEYAKSIIDYRFDHLAQAKALAASEHCAGADFPWESADSGKEVAPGGFSEGRHVTAGVGWATWQYYLATQDKPFLKSEGWPLLCAIADYWSTRAVLDPKDGKFHIRKVYGPDELKGEVDDNTYTNAMARDCLNAAVSAAAIVGQRANAKWATVASKLALPFDAANHRYLARADDKGEKTKQADGELVIYPAELPMDKQTADATFAWEAARPIKNGPAMTASIHALIAARLGHAAEAETAFRDSYRPFIRGPFLLLSEKRSMDRCVFTTGAGGILQSVLYGFGGIDWNHWDQMAKSPVCLPPTWKKLTITGVRHAVKRYTVTVTPGGRTVTAE